MLSIVKDLNQGTNAKWNLYSVVYTSPYDLRRAVGGEQ